jgi:hypothetical protein
MKRLILLIFVVMLAYMILVRHHAADFENRNGRHFAHGHKAARQLLAKAGKAIEETGHEIRHAVGEASQEFLPAAQAGRGAIHPNDDDVIVAGSVGAQASVVEREDADGLPVPIVPGTRVTQAQALPPYPARSKINTRRWGSPPTEKPIVINTGAAEIPTLAGEISATPARADQSARETLRKAITTWLDPDVPSTWSLPERELDQLALLTARETVERKDDLGPMYITHLTLDTTPAHRERLVKLYNRELVGRRLIRLGGSLAFILMCLAAVSGYIRADEASKGYYTNRLRMLAAAGVGAGGVLIYQMVT